MNIKVEELPSGLSLESKLSCIELDVINYKGCWCVWMNRSFLSPAASLKKTKYMVIDILENKMINQMLNGQESRKFIKILLKFGLKTSNFFLLKAVDSSVILGCTSSLISLLSLAEDEFKILKASDFILKNSNILREEPFTDKGIWEHGNIREFDLTERVSSSFIKDELVDKLDASLGDDEIDAPETIEEFEEIDVD